VTSLSLSLIERDEGDGWTLDFELTYRRV